MSNGTSAFGPGTAWQGTYPPSEIRSEMPYSKEDKQQLGGRLKSEYNWLKHAEVTVWATVQGWLKSSGGLWKENEEYTVTSPMLVMDGTTLRAKSVTFTQDDKNGTRTTVELCNPRAFGGSRAPIQSP